MISLPRWLRLDRCASNLSEHDVRMAEARGSGVVLVEVHYRHGDPVLARVREMVLPIAAVELRLASTS